MSTPSMTALSRVHESALWRAAAWKLSSTHLLAWDRSPLVWVARRMDARSAWRMMFMMLGYWILYAILQNMKTSSVAAVVCSPNSSELAVRLQRFAAS